MFFCGVCRTICLPDDLAYVYGCVLPGVVVRAGEQLTRLDIRSGAGEEELLWAWWWWWEEGEKRVAHVKVKIRDGW